MTQLLTVTTFNVFRLDRKFTQTSCSTGGGVFIALCNEIKYEVSDTTINVIQLIDLVMCRCKFNIT